MTLCLSNCRAFMDLPNELLHIILSYSKFYNQDRLARTRKQIYKQYCEYRKELLCLDKKFTSDNFENHLIIINNDYTIDKLYCPDYHIDVMIACYNEYRKIYRVRTSRPIGFIDLSSLQRNNQYNCYIRSKHILMHYSHAKNGCIENIINTSKYNNLKCIDCPFTSKIDIYPIDLRKWLKKQEFNIWNFNHFNSSNYCSLNQCIIEMISLHDFIETVDLSKIISDSFLEPYLIQKEREDAVQNFYRIVAETQLKNCGLFPNFDSIKIET